MRTRSRFLAVLTILCLVSFSTLSPALARYAPSEGLELLSLLPKDPVLVWVISTEELAATLDEFVEMILRFTPDDASFNVDEAIHKWEAQVGLAVREDLLAQIGPELAVVIDLPAPDQLMAALAAEDTGALFDLLGGIGKVIQVRDAWRMDETLAERIESSPLIPMIVADSPESRPMIDALLSREFVGVGLGSTSLEMHGGIRRTTFGPTGLSGGLMVAGIVAAVAIPNLLNAIDRGKQKRTMADIRSIGTVCEAYAIDNNVYPGPTEGWVPVDAIAEEVEPVYIRGLPRVDGWGNPILFWSDATSTCRIVSYGRDGVPERDWSGEIEPHATMEFTAEIVFGNGQFLVWPEGSSR